MFKLNKKGSLMYYTVPAFLETGLVRHCFTTRHGGVSEGSYSSMNLRVHSDDKWENILENFNIITDAVGMKTEDLVLSKQIHEDIVQYVDKGDCGNGILYENKFKSADALITDKSNVGLVIFSADCVPVLFLDTKQRVIAAAHSGWRGTVKRIAQKVTEKMKSDYNSNPEDILAAIGPSIQADDFEVGDEVAQEFIKEFGADTAPKYGGRYHVDMQLAIKKQLNDEGIVNIFDCAVSTYQNPELLFSHRKMHGREGHIAAFLELV